MRCSHCGTENSEGSKFCEHCGKPISGTSTVTASTPDYSKKLGWHKFMIYFSLFAGALMNVVNGIQYLTGEIYGNDKAKVYMGYSDLQGIDIIYGLALIGIAGYVIYVRFQLSGFKIGAPKKLAIAYTLNFIVTPLYMGFVELETGISLLNTNDISSFIGSLFGTLVVVVISIVYYSKRKHLFVNK